MRPWKWSKRRAWGLAAAVGLSALAGCTYLGNRGRDALQMVEIGVTASEKPSFSLYACLLGLGSAGAGHVDGHVYGIGGGRAGRIRHYQKSLGLLLWSYEEIGWGDEMNPEEPETLDYRYIGPVGWITEPKRLPGYAPA